MPLCSDVALNAVLLRRPRCRCAQMSAFNAVVLRLPRLDVGTQEHLETPKRTAGTETRDLGSEGTPEYIKMEEGKINPWRTV